MRKSNYLNVLSSNEIYDIHIATLNVLENSGVVIYEDFALKILKEAGAKVDEKSKNVKIPSYLLEEALKKVPKKFTIYARNPKHNVTIEEGKVFYEPMIGRINIIDLNTRVKRRTTIKDIENLVRLADAMKSYHLLHSGAMMPHIEGIPDQVTHIYGYLASIRNTTKPVKGTARGKVEARDCIKLASVLAGSNEELKKKPCLFTTCNPVSPLQHNKEQIEGLIEYARHGLPIDIASEPQAGATAPVTLAGLLVQQNAEILSGITIAQLVRAGTPVFYGTCGTVMDMRVGAIALGALELGLINVASAQIARYYGIPSRGTGATTNSKVIDVQAGYEKAITLMLATLAGINCIFYPGVLEDALSISLEALLIDEEICGMALRALEGIEVNDETLAVDIINKVGPGGHYLNQRHTIKFLQKEHFMPRLSNRESREVWEAKGAKDLWDIAKDEVKRILSTHKPEPLPKDVELELAKTVKEIEKERLKRSNVR
jgi:trimethylamine--corrinoid protein Co-methyltransferase